MWVVARGQLTNLMNLMLLLVVVASFAIVQIATALVVLGLVLFNVVMGTKQELKARASVEALAKLQVPHARVRRSGQVDQIESTKLVPGDIVLLEAGDVVPADGRIISSATLEVPEAALTGESAPVPKDPGTLPEQARAAGKFTPVHDAWWAAASKAHRARGEGVRRYRLQRKLRQLDQTLTAYLTSAAG